MADISKCIDNTCPYRVKCYRYRAVDSPYRQSFAGFRHDPKTGKCEYFWDITGDHNTDFLSVKDADNIIARMKG